VNGQVLEARVDNQSEGQSENANENAEKQKFVAVNAQERDLGKVGELQPRFAAGFLGRGGSGGEHRQQRGSGAKLGESLAQ
jgi:hypothetical protein